MFNLIKADIFKLFKVQIVKISFLVSVVCSIMIAIVLHGVYKGTYTLETSSAFALVSDTMIVAMLGAILIGTLICGDFESKNIHDEIACGNGRFSIIMAKTITISLLMILLVLPYAIVAIVGFASNIGFGVYTGVPSAFFNILANAQGVELSSQSILKSIVLTLFITLSYIAKVSICIPLAFKARRSLIVIIAGFISTFIFDIISAVAKGVKGINEVVQLLPFTNIFKLTLDCTVDVMLKSMIYNFLFIAAMIGITYVMFRKAEIK